MEQKLFILGIISLIFYLISKKLINNGLLDNRKPLIIWNMFSMAVFAIVFIVILSVIVQNSGTGHELGEGFLLTSAGIFLTAIIIGFFQARGGGEEKIKKVQDDNIEWFSTIYFAALLASFVMFFFVQAFKIPSSSMEKTLLKGDHLFVSKMTYGIRFPYSQERHFPIKKVSRGDIIIFKFPSDSKTEKYCGSSQYDKIFVKRIIGLPGETVETKGEQVFINGKPLPESYANYDNIRRNFLEEKKDSPEEYQRIWENRNLGKHYGMYLRDSFGPVVVPEDSYFVMGDNRDHSCDSRFWGPVPKENISGTPLFIHWPIDRMGIIK